ncbi:dCTP deaminase domain-containing protein [Actinoplanes sp. NPDC049316]|uniref:dCTP deaminase domain-containing protein n=1 Tax=Actinoplanes sp. NPDC049316 TaxID=3154727 RepID=UPI0034269214
MRMCSRDEILTLISTGKLVAQAPENDELVFLDEHRIGLHMDRLYEVSGTVHLDRPDSADLREVSMETEELTPQVLYLGVTRESFLLHGDLAATLHTRSTYARLGLELLGSSNVVVPGFGSTRAAPLIFEISVKQPTSGFRPDKAYCFMLLYQLHAPRRSPNRAPYWRRFPLQTDVTNGSPAGEHKTL